MILIADSGSTKTDWRLIDDQKEIHQFKTMGFNPYFVEEEFMVDELMNKLLPEINKIISKNQLNIYFYGAGCSVEEQKNVIRGALKKCFPNAVIEVEHDLLAAARALCGKEEGIAAILGTGSNSCYYDGENIVENIISLGYVLGDEGSGAHLGKTFISAYLNKELPENIRENFEARFKTNKDEILEAVYRKPFPNRYLASFSKFIFQNSKEIYLMNLVSDCLEQFLEKHICKYEKYQELPLNCVGSVAFYYADILRKLAAKKNIKIGKIIASPIAALTLYHLDS